MRGQIDGAEPKPGMGRIVALRPTDRHNNMTSLNDLRTYWNAISPAPGAVPPRLSVQARAIETSLHAALIVERTAPGIIRFRIAGRDLAEVMGMEPRQMPLLALFDVTAKERALRLIEEVFITPAIAELRLEAETPDGRASAQLHLMPLTDYLGRVSMALGGFALDGASAASPCRFSVVDARVVKLKGGSVTHPGCFATDAIQEAAEAPAPFRGAPRLVYSRDEG